MRILPVIDLRGGQVVRGVAGRREEYRPVESRIAPSADPLAVAQAFRSHLGLDELYLADLDALAGGRSDLKTYRALRANGFHLWVDAGLRRAEDAEPLFLAGIERVVAGTETLESTIVLPELCMQWGGEAIVLSLDFLPGRAWERSEIDAQVQEAVEVCGVRSLILLDLARVGLGQGPGTEEICRGIAELYPDVEILVGGGIRTADDLHSLRQAGARGALIASAFHDCRIRRNDLAQL